MTEENIYNKLIKVNQQFTFGGRKMNRLEKREYLRKHILESIVELCENKSLYDLKTDEIAKKADVSKRTLYEYFSGKDYMYLGLVEYSFQELNLYIDQKIASIEENDILNKILTIGEGYLEYIIKEPVLGKFVTEYDESKYIKMAPEVIYQISLVANKYEISPFLEKLFEENKVRNVDSKEMGLMLWAHIHGLAILISTKGKFVYSYYNTDEIKIIRDSKGYIKDMIEDKMR